jgi:hypothetical protein
MDLSDVRTPEFLPRQTRYIVGCDLGKRQDPSVITIIQAQTGVIDRGSPLERHTNVTTGLKLQSPGERYRVVRVESQPLDTPYDIILDRIKFVATHEKLRATNQKPCDLVIDQSGVGMPICDWLEKAGLRPVRVTITGGNDLNPAGLNRWNVSLHYLMTQYDASINHPEFPLRFSLHLAERAGIIDEHRTFEHSVGGSGAKYYGAREGRHDDRILATALANWWARRPPNKQASWSTYGTPLKPSPTNTWGR